MTLLLGLLRSLFIRRKALVLENLALRQQLAAYKRACKRPVLRTFDRAFWVWMSTHMKDWQSALLVVKPDTVIRWHRMGFKLYWRWKSRARRPGRPRIPQEHIDFIRRISVDNPRWGEDKIAQELKLKLGVNHSPSTIRRYIVRKPDPHRGQRWRTFIKNHGNEILACDFMLQYTALFDVVYVFVVMELGSRKIVHYNVTRSPTLEWVKLQFRDLVGFSRPPRFVLHDNDGIFGQYGFAKVSNGRGHRCHLDLWLWQTLGIKGIPTPYRAPNANAQVERFNRTLRQDALDHFIFLNEAHVRRVVREFVEYYNRARPSQATGAIPDPYPELQRPPTTGGKLIALPVLGGVQNDYRLAA